MTESWRTPFQRDTDIVLYSSAWRRLRGVTQVLPITDGIGRTHDRLMHSLKVAQVGMRGAQYLIEKFPKQAARLAPEAVFVAGMAHDLGHPPFGHVAEDELQHTLADEMNRWRLQDSFEGNAQTFRILTRLSKKRAEPPHGGMGLTPVSLAACTKYPWPHKQALSVIGETAYAKNPKYFDKKWGYYDSDAEAWLHVKDELVGATLPHPNAVMMDIADDITYAVHDVLDYFRLHLIPLHEIGFGVKGIYSSPEYEQFTEYAWNSLTIRSELGLTSKSKGQAISWLSQITYPAEQYADSDDDRRALHAFESDAVQAVQDALALKDETPTLPDHVQLALAYLKELTWFYVINHPHLSASQEGQRRIVRDLHAWTCEWIDSAQSNKGDFAALKNERDLRRLPGRLWSLVLAARNSGGLEGERLSRAAVDFITGLTDAEAISLHRQLGGATASVSAVSWL